MEKQFETYKDGYIKSDIVLSIGILVSNNVQYIEKCMEGLKPLLDNTKSELIILDTVGHEKSDGSIDICRKYTDKIYRFEWINDFAAARNELIKHSRGEWFMYQDDDEWFDDVSELIEFFNGADCHKYNFGCYCARNHAADGSQSTCNTLRMIRRRPETHMLGKIHEVFSEKTLPGKQFSSFVHHMGYYYTTEEEQRRKITRNITLLDAEIAELGIDTGRCAQKVQELLRLKETWDEGFKLSVEYTDALIKRGREASTYVQWMISAQVRYFSLKNDHEGVIRQSELVRKKYRLARFTELVTAYLELCSVMILGNVKSRLILAENDVKKYLEIFDFFKKHPDEEVRETQLDFAYFIEPEQHRQILGYAGVISALNHDYDNAVAYWKKQNGDPREKVGPYKGRLFEVLEREEGLEGIKRFYLNFMNPAVFDESNEKYIPKYLRDKMGVFTEPDEIPKSSDVERRIVYLDALPIEKFSENVKSLAEEVRLNGGNTFEDPFLAALLEAYEGSEGPEYYRLLGVMAENEIKRAVENGADGKAIDELMTEYMNTVRNYYELLYLPISFGEGMIKWLPEDCRFNDALYRFKEGTQKELQLVLDAAKLRPDMAKVLSTWVGGRR